MILRKHFAVPAGWGKRLCPCGDQRVTLKKGFACTSRPPSKQGRGMERSSFQVEKLRPEGLSMYLGSLGSTLSPDLFCFSCSVLFETNLTMVPLAVLEPSL